MTADPPTSPTQDQLAEIEEHFSDCAECEEAHIPTDDARWLIEEVKRLRAALERIRTEGGRVCATFELCTHVACQSSVAAWMIADAALNGETPESANAKAATDRATPSAQDNLSDKPHVFDDSLGTGRCRTCMRGVLSHSTLPADRTTPKEQP